MKLIIFCHPTHDSHSGNALKTIEKTFKKNKTKYEIVDLYKDKFTAELSAKELSNMKNRKGPQEDVIAMQEKITNADTLVFIYPVWWYGVPALLKGFLDRVITAGFAYRFKKNTSLRLAAGAVVSYIPGIRYLVQPFSTRGLLKDKKAVIIRTFGGPELGRRVFGKTESALENGVLRFCGLTKIKIFELFAIDTSLNTPEKEAKFYKKLEKHFS